jgi:acetoin utilization protein AcuB
MNLHDLMTSRVVTVELDDPLEAVKKIFDSVKFHHLLVVEAGKLCGVISDRDLLRALSPYVGTRAETARDAATLKKRVHQIMTRKPVTLPPEATLGDAVKVFLEHGVSCIPVVDASFKPIGIVSWRDLLKSWPTS